jgi:hypothetical protein
LLLLVAGHSNMLQLPGHTTSVARFMKTKYKIQNLAAV